MRSRDFGRRSQCEAQPPGVRGRLTAPRRKWPASLADYAWPFSEQVRSSSSLAAILVTIS
jgi:hypothetical protein